MHVYSMDEILLACSCFAYLIACMSFLDPGIGFDIKIGFNMTNNKF